MNENISISLRISVQEALEWIELNLSKPLLRRTISEKMECSELEFQRRFIYVTGMTPTVYIRYRKMLMAQQMLMDGKSSIADIAKYLAYSKHTNFCKAFKKYFSITPSQYRINKTSGCKD